MGKHVRPVSSNCATGLNYASLPNYVNRSGHPPTACMPKRACEVDPMACRTWSFHNQNKWIQCARIETKDKHIRRSEVPGEISPDAIGPEEELHVITSRRSDFPSKRYVGTIVRT